MSAREASIPLRTAAWTNARGHSAGRDTSKRKKSERLGALALWVMLGRIKPLAPCTITFERFSPGTLDDDNLPSAFKYIRDELVRLMGFADDSKRSGIVFRYEQHQDKTHGVRVSVSYLAKQ